MADIIRERILAALKTQLETILVTNGYETNIGQKIYRGLKGNEDLDSAPGGLVIWDSDESIEPLHGHYKMSQNVELEVIIPWDFETQTQGSLINIYYGDITKCLMVPNPAYGNLIERINLIAMSPGLAESGSQFVALGLVYNIQYETQRQDLTLQ